MDCVYNCLHFLFFFFNDTATTEIYTLSLHDALPILACLGDQRTRIPGTAPECGSRMYRPGCAFSSAAEAANTIPSDIPNFILRGARLATITVSLPTRSSGA